MTDDAFLDELGAAVRDDARAHASDARWQRLTAGTLSAEERAALEREALEDPAAGEMLAMYAPLDEAAFARFEDAARSALGPPEATRGERPAARAKVVGPRSGWARRLVFAAAPLAAAAALVLWLRAPSAPLGAYDVVVTTADDAMRSTEAPLPGPSRAHQTGRTFELVASPAGGGGAVEAHAFLERDGAVTPWAPPMQVSPQGTVRIAGDTDALFGTRAGAVTVLLAIGRPGHVPDSAAVVARGEGATGESATWRLVREEIVLGRR
jgi:hypothetical protein